jgi:uncharacterized protein (TIGR02118 family)
MALLSLLYPDQPGARFDARIYLDRHVPKVRALWEPMGLTEIRLLRGVGTPDGGPAPYRVLALLTFTSAAALRRALDAHAAELFAGIAAYTDIRPVVQVSETLD